MTTEELLTPNYGKLEISFRSIGYSFETAVADVIDNSIDAKASEILVRLITAKAKHFDVAIWDNGCGMHEVGLKEAMRFGADVSNELDRLGMSGLDLNLACLSRARTLQRRSACCKPGRRPQPVYHVRCESHYIPQAQHSVIITGVRMGHESKNLEISGLGVLAKRAFETLIGRPRPRGRLSDGSDSSADWIWVKKGQLLKVGKCPTMSGAVVLERVHFTQLERGATHYSNGTPARHPDIRDQLPGCGPQPETDKHMERNLGRYLSCAVFPNAHHCSPASTDFPESLLPEHRNWQSRAFADRCRAQVATNSAHAGTRHLSKTGHAFVYHDPAHCRRLTVRQAARLRTLSDDYLFLGNRTGRSEQVKNTALPLLSHRFAPIVSAIAGESMT